MSLDRKPLAQAFVHQSLAAAKNRMRSQKARQDGQQNAALVLLALAEAQEVHAKKALAFLRGRIGSSAENLALALLEAREMAVESLGWTMLSEAQSDKSAATLLTQMARAVSSHLALPGLAKGGADGPSHACAVCAVCGHAHTGEAAGRCPVCQALPEDSDAEAASSAGYYVCAICGYVHAGETPGRCPVCQAVPEKFNEVMV